MASYVALYGRKCRTSIGWFEVGESKLIGPELIQQAVDKSSLFKKGYWLLRVARSLMQIGNEIWRFSDKRLGVPKDITNKGCYEVRCIKYPSRVVPIDDVQITEQLSYEEAPIAILDRQVHRLRTKDVASVKVLWRNKNVEEMTWEAEKDMKSRYPHLLPTPEQMQTTAQASSDMYYLPVTLIGREGPLLLLIFLAPCGILWFGLLCGELVVV
ncbi:uncharacterized protein LOC132061255 [Lycium ferocissimum]|uniref:uncharacterized protein LOC132061255 n=1 Tax=Lycium ferocissimum TaxID=112874 RepID=UPI0028151172|nr:uncharacterized protein LOC132061255 [Lycium ferocissimum]